jgi:hypothetical protein
VIQNNVVYGFGSMPLVWAESSKSLSGITLGNNVYYSPNATPFRIGSDSVQNMNLLSWLTQALTDTLSVLTDPLLLDATAFQAAGTTPYDYTKADLKASSPARGVGKAQSAFSNNLTGATRSVWNAGAF